MKAAVEVAGSPKSRVLYRLPRRVYPMAVKASGVTITDSAGRSYLDMSGGAAVSSVGHAHPAVIAAVQKQLQTLAFAHTSFFTNDPQEQLASLTLDEAVVKLKEPKRGRGSGCSRWTPTVSRRRSTRCSKPPACSERDSCNCAASAPWLP